MLLKKLLVWYLPQAALFCLGVWFSVEQKGTAQMPIIFGLAFAGVYTAAMVVLIDAPTNWRGLSKAGRVFFGVLYGAAALLALAAGGMALARTAPLEAIIALVAIFILLLLLISLPLAFWTRDIRPWIISRQKTRRARGH